MILTALVSDKGYGDLLILRDGLILSYVNSLRVTGLCKIRNRKSEKCGVWKNLAKN